MDSQVVDVVSPSGEEFRVTMVPAGTPVRADALPGTGIIDNVAYTVFVWIREATARSWKVAVIKYRGQWDGGEVRYSSKVPRSRAASAHGELVTRCEAGEFDLDSET